MIEEKYENLDKITNKNINKIKESKSTNNFTANYNFTNDDDDSISDKNSYKYNIDISDKYKQEYRFNNDENLLDSFSKVYGKNNIKYEPRDNTKFIRVRYLLKRSKENEDINTSLYNHFHTSLSEKDKLYHKIPTYELENGIISKKEYTKLINRINKD